ncbi:MAG TPA: SH3 domain-containing protein [Bryobacteraceae bacterium]|nr:SH3 domain-containing protein [Bryobacteraceae bacterium]
MSSKSPTVATVKHGDKLDVLELRRRFIRVRTTDGVEGWTDSNLLLTDQQMGDLRRLAEDAAKLASQGKATPFDVLNMHSAPSRQSPSFFQIAEGESVEIIGHQVAPHSAPPDPVQLQPPVKHAAPPKKPKSKLTKSTQAPPMPSPPAPPRNWQDLSKPRGADLASPARASAAAAVAAVTPQFDDWNLVRTKDGKVGWVLARMLTMSIPDEVAQYAEGHRITAYLPVGEVAEKGRDKQGQVKHNWLWTTSSAGTHPFEFDSFRVFVWSTKRHHYETAFIERNVQGFYPIETHDLPDKEEKAFSVVLREKDGKLYKRTYAFSGYHVRMMSKTPYTPPPPLPEVRTTRDFDPPPPPPQESVGIKQRLADLRKKWFGR